MQLTTRPILVALAVAIARAITCPAQAPAPSQIATSAPDTVKSSDGSAALMVPLDDRVYADIDALVAEGLIDRVILGQRPFTRREVMRLLIEAQGNLAHLATADAAWAQRVIANGVARYGPARLFESVRADETLTNEPARPAPGGPTGGIDARIEPLVAYSGGRRVDPSSTAGVETRHALALGQHLALSLSPRAYLSAPRPSASARAMLELREGAADMSYGNLLVAAGRQEILFGLPVNGGLVLSRNAPPLDAIRITNDRPAALPWVFRYLGPMRGTLFVADLGPNQHFPYAQLVGIKLSGQPFSSLEISMHALDEMGGRGAPPSTFGDRVLDALIVPDLFRTHSDFQFSNKFVGGDMRWRVPAVRGVEVYGEATLDDFDKRRFRSSFLDDGGYIFGLSAVCLTQCGVWRLNGEYHQTGIRYFTHGQFSTGYAENGFLLGDPLGPRGLGGYAKIERDALGAGTFSFQGALEVRSGNLYDTAFGVNDTNFHFVQVVHRPGERRVRGMLSWRSPRDLPLDVRLSGGLEHVSDWAFNAGVNRMNGLAQVVLEFRP